MVRINAVLPEALIEKLDKIARDLKKSRSMLLREATKKLIEEYQQSLEEAQRKKKIKRAISAQNRLRKKSGQWDGVAEVRKWRETKP